MTKHIALYFDAPMQSWGVASRYNNRGTLGYPTRSAITGIVAAAMGKARDDRDFLARFAEYRCEIYVLPRVLRVESRYSESKTKTFAANRFSDYHTVGGGYDEKKESERLSVPRKAEDGKPKGTELTTREYLSDARFGAVFWRDDESASPTPDEIAAALADPIWGVWLGRKCCVPASPIFQGLFDDKATALARLCERSGCDAPSKTICEVVSTDDANRDLTDDDFFDLPDDELFDLPVSFSASARSERSAYLKRRVKVKSRQELENREGADFGDF